MCVRSGIQKHSYRLSLVISTIVAASLFHSCIATAQELTPWQKLYFNPWINYQTLDEALQEIPQLTEDQRTIIEAIHDDYLSEIHSKPLAYKTVILEAAAKRKREQDGRHQFYRRTSNDTTQNISNYDATDQLQWRADKPVIEKKFREEVKSVFSKEQNLTWESIMRRLQRERQFPALPVRTRTFYFGTCDLVRVVEELNLTEDETANIKSSLDEYAAEANKILDKVEIDGPRIHLEDYVYKRNAPNQERKQDVYKWYDNIKLETARMCFTHYDQILPLIPDRCKDVFIDKCGESFWPVLFLNEPADNAFDALKKCDLLPTHIVARLEVIEKRHLSLRKSIYTQIVKRQRYLTFNPDDEAVAAIQAERQAFDAEARANPDVFRTFSLPGEEDWRQRHLLNLRTCRQLKALFTDEEFKNLPAGIQLLLSI